MSIHNTVQEMIQPTSIDVDAHQLAFASRLDDRMLRALLVSRGVDVGPITSQTRILYVNRLARLLSESSNNNNLKSTSSSKYSSELRSAIDGRLDTHTIDVDERALRESFADTNRHWREGRLKMSFCYLLIDPRLFDTIRSHSHVTFATFLDAVFYVGKGKRGRPLQHLIDTARALQSPSADDENGDKVDRIVSLWRNRRGVISLHIFQNIIPVEAFTREAAMIDAFGVENLTNARRGDYYGASSTWTMHRRRRFGAYLLSRAWQMFRIERSPQLFPADVLAT